MKNIMKDKKLIVKHLIKEEHNRMLRSKIMDTLQDNYSIEDAVQEFLGWSEEDSENADGTNWDDVVDVIMADRKLRSQFK